MQPIRPFGARVVVIIALATLAHRASGQTPVGGEGADLSLEFLHYDQLGNTFAIRSVGYLLDGKELIQLRGPELKKRLASAAGLHRVSLSPGVHVIGVQVVYEGRSGLFQYLDKYRFTMRGYVLMESKPGYRVKVISKVVERGSLVEQWQNRPSFKLAALPEKAVLKVRVSRVERIEMKNPDGESEIEPLAVTVSAEDAKLLENRVVQDAEEKKPPVELAEADPAVDAQPQACGRAVVYFRVGRATLNAKGRRALQMLAECLARSSRVHMRVEGHCDRRGSHALNDRLGEGRAKAAVDFLEAHGVASERLEAVSFGKRRPFCAQASETCYSRNRRAEVAPQSAGVGTARRPKSSVAKN